MSFVIKSGLEIDNLNEENSRMCTEVWPELMLHDAVANRYFGKLFDYFMEYQFAICNSKNDDVVAIGNTIPFSWDGKVEDLPEGGWDWVLQKGVSDYENKIVPNFISAIQIMVGVEYKGQGISYRAVENMRSIAKAKGIKYLVAPVRPSMKHLYPLIDIENYINWKNDEGLPFDAWLRVHARAGGKIIKPCRKAMLIEGSVHDWEEWTKLKFPESGRYVVPLALNPIEIDLDIDIGRYIEPNVWVAHQVL